MMEPSSITTRAKAQKSNNLIQGVTESKEKSKRSLREKRSIDTRDNLETTIKQSEETSVRTKVRVGRSKKKNVSNRRHNMVKEAGSKDRDKNQSINFNKSKVSKDMHDENVPTINNDLSRCINLGDLNRTPKEVQQETIVSNTKGLFGMVTPKSTPIKLNLTPHRSTKTPKKSPVSLTSPKTHSVSVSKLLKTPRKLSLTPGESLYMHNNDSGDTKLRKAKKNSSRDISVSNKSSPAALSVVKSKRNVSGVKLSGIVHRFSKSPKIVLRSPSKKSKLPKLNLSASRKSPLKKRTFASTIPGISSSHSSRKPSHASAKKTPLPEQGKSLSTYKRQLLSTRLAKLLTASQMRDVLAEPIVLLKKLPLESKPDTLTTVDNQSNESINTKYNAKVTEVTARNIFAESKTSARLKGSCRSSTAKLTNKSADKLSPATVKYSSPAQRENKPSTPLMSSTPREEEMPSTRANLMSNTSILSVVDGTCPDTKSKYTNQSSIHAAQSPGNIMGKCVAIEDVSQPSLLNVDISNQVHLSNAARQDATYDANEMIEPGKGQNNKRNVTYELKDPQTPDLRQMTRKRTMTDANLSAKENVKKSCKVHFANVKPDENGAYNPIVKSTGLQSNVPRNSYAQRNIRIMNSAYKSRKVENLKFNQGSLTSPLNAKSSPKMARLTPKGRLHSLDAVTLNFDKTQTTPKGLESIEKKSGKVQSTIVSLPHCIFTFE